MAELRSRERDFSEKVLRAAGLQAEPVPERFVVIAGRGRPPVVFVQEDPGEFWIRFDWPEGLAGREHVSPGPLADLIRMVL